MRNFLIFAFLVILGNSARAQWLNYRPPGTPVTPDGKPDLSAPAPHAPNGKPDLTGTWPLVRSVGYARALEICATGRWVGAAEAVAIGLATAAVPEADLDATVGDLVGALLAAPAGAVRETLVLLRGASDRTPGEQQAAERAAQARRLRELAQGDR